jgi:hypothetical protein
MLFFQNICLYCCLFLGWFGFPDMNLTKFRTHTNHKSRIYAISVVVLQWHCHVSLPLQSHQGVPDGYAIAQSTVCSIWQSLNYCFSLFSNLFVFHYPLFDPDSETTSFSGIWSEIKVVDSILSNSSEISYLAIIISLHCLSSISI